MARFAKRSMVFLMSFCLAGCRDLLGICGDKGVEKPGVILTITDSLSGAAVGSGFTIVVTNPSGTGETLPVSGIPASGTYIDFGNAAGFYSVTVQAVGYRDWARTNISVGKSCGVLVTEMLTVRMQRV